jgi:hypothetical protein
MSLMCFAVCAPQGVHIRPTDTCMRLSPLANVAPDQGAELQYLTMYVCVNEFATLRCSKLL